MLDFVGRKTGDKPCSTIDTLIGANTEIVGNIFFTGGLRVDGKIKGDVTAKGEGNCTLVLSEQAVITGDVSAPFMVVNGRIVGNVRASERIALQGKAEIAGDLNYNLIEIAAGAVLNGQLTRDHGVKLPAPARLTGGKTVDQVVDIEGQGRSADSDTGRTVRNR